MLDTRESIPELRFKGGTSPSKVFRLIDRLSEDIDISINRAALGFSGERDLANAALTVTKRKALYLEFRSAITTEVQSRILPKLQESFQHVLGKDGWKLLPSDQENEEMTLLFHYPNAFEYSGYLQSQIKVEFGRGDQQPSRKSFVTANVAEEFPDVFRVRSAPIFVLDSERTFWEKMTLLHAENHRPDPSKLKARMARHWSDIAVMSTAARFQDAKLSLDLLPSSNRLQENLFRGELGALRNCHSGSSSNCAKRSATGHPSQGLPTDARNVSQHASLLRANSRKAHSVRTEDKRDAEEVDRAGGSLVHSRCGFGLRSVGKIRVGSRQQLAIVRKLYHQEHHEIGSDVSIFHDLADGTVVLSARLPRCPTLVFSSETTFGVVLLVGISACSLNLSSSKEFLAEDSASRLICSA